MAINRPDDPLGNERNRRSAPQDHPDRRAHLQERADGAHAEQVDAPAPTPPQDPSQPPEASDRPASREDTAGAPDAGRTGRPLTPAVAVVVGVLVVMGIIYAAMVAGVFTVG